MLVPQDIFPARSALEWLLTSVYSDVSYQTILLQENFLAYRACVRVIIDVHFFMECQVAVPRDSFPAFNALKTLL